MASTLESNVIRCCDTLVIHTPGVAGAGRRGTHPRAARPAAHGAPSPALDAAPRPRSAAALPVPGAGRAGGARRAARGHLPLYAEATAGFRPQLACLHGLHMEPDHTPGPGEISTTTHHTITLTLLHERSQH